MTPRTYLILAVTLLGTVGGWLSTLTAIGGFHALTSPGAWSSLAILLASHLWAAFGINRGNAPIAKE